ncbi:MAG: RagB/SusD family nutrient uptake outer membrane protein [Bacteroidales bacterium]|nr:RagB/SusD family nutrient uptake outer membrane protein [Bacteroidales bacterium]
MKKFIITISIMAGVLSMASCSLEEDTSAIVSPYDFYKTVPQIRAAVNGCYDPLNEFHNLKYLIATEGATDLASTNGSAQQDARFEISPSSPGAATITWRQCWVGVRLCLSTLAGIGRSPLSESEKSPYAVETRILLSYYYYVLTSFFGDVPFYEDYVENDDDMQRIAQIGRMSAVETRKTLIEELKLYVPTLPQVRTSDQQYNYCGAAMGWMMIAKMAAWNKDWDEVIYACEHLEAIYGDLNQYPYMDVCFRNKNTPESIFEINHEFVEGGIDYTPTQGLSISSIVLPKRGADEAGTDSYDGVPIPEVGDKAYSYTPLRPTTYMKTTVAPTGTGDIRREINMATGWNGVKFKGSRTWMGQKFWCFHIYQNHDFTNYKIFRYADALLLLAEAWCEKGNYSKSIDYLNKVRTRAEISPYSYVSAVKLRGEIRDERGRELFGEFGRKFDLVRWGIWYDQVVAYNGYNLAVQNVRPCHEYYPIPDVQCARTGRVLSNPEYEKYGL